MAKIRLYIADTDPIFTVHVMNRASRRGDIQPVGCAADGMEALRQIAESKPDVLLTDLQLPGIDGSALIQHAQRLKPQPVAIACTRFYSDMMLESARHSGADYFLCKPVSCERLLQVVAGCWKVRSSAPRPAAAARAEDQDRRDVCRLRGLLNDMGIPPRLSGSLYIIEAALRLRDNELLLGNLSKGLYAELAEHLNTRPACVERSLRTAIAHAYAHGGLDRHFPARPSNRQFIEYVAGALKDSDAAPQAEIPRIGADLLL